MNSILSRHKSVPTTVLSKRKMMKYQDRLEMCLKFKVNLKLENVNKRKKGLNGSVKDGKFRKSPIS